MVISQDDTHQGSRKHHQCFCFVYFVLFIPAGPAPSTTHFRRPGFPIGAQRIRSLAHALLDNVGCTPVLQQSSVCHITHNKRHTLCVHTNKCPCFKFIKRTASDNLPRPPPQKNDKYQRQKKQEPGIITLGCRVPGGWTKGRRFLPLPGTRQSSLGFPCLQACIRR